MMDYKVLFSKFFFILGESKSFIPILIFVSLMNSIVDILGISLLVPFFNFIFFPENEINYFFELFDKFSKEELVLYSGILIIISFFLKIFVATYLYYFLVNFSLLFQRNLKIKVLNNFLNINYLEFTKSKTAHYFELITNLIPIFSNEVLMPIFKILSNLILIITLSILMYVVNPKVFFILIIFLIILSIMYIFFSKRNKIYGEKASIANENFLKTVKDIIFGYLEIFIFKKKFFFLDRSKKYSKTNLNYIMKSLIIGFVSKYIIEFMLVSFFVLYIFFLFFFDKSNLNEALTIIIVYTAVSVRLSPSFNVIINSFASINFGLFSIEKIYSTISNKNFKSSQQIENSTINEMENKDLKFENIFFKNVFFSYNQKDKIIENLNVEIKKNQIIGVSGSSGSGKTTFLNLFLGFIQPTSGTILLNNKVNLPNNIWTNQIAYMPQDIFLFSDSIKTNITLKETINQKEYQMLIDAIEKVDLKEFLHNQKDGIDTVISDTGLNFSGGQKQRLALARSIYHNKEILVLDESTSALDSITISKIIELLLVLKKEKTIIISSHNPDVLKICDKIIKLG